jgi:hypothetical protein
MRTITNELPPAVAKPEPVQAATAMLREMQRQTAALNRIHLVATIIAVLVAVPLVFGIITGVLYVALHAGH